MYQRIQADRRHAHTLILETSPIDQRVFADWTMGFLTWNEETKGIFNAYMPGEDFNLYRIDPAKAVDMFKAFAGSANWLVSN